MGTVPAPNIVEAAQQIAATPQNTLAEYARVAQLKQATAYQQQATQAQNLENQKQQLALQDQQAATKAMHQWDGQDMNALPDLMRKNGISAPGYMDAQQKVVARKTQLAQLDKDQLENMKGHHDAALGVIDSAKQVPDDQLSQHISDSVQQLQAQGHLSPQESQNVIQHAQSMPPDQFRPWLDVYEKGLMGEKSLIDQANKERELKTKETEAQTTATSAQTTANRLQAEMPGGALETPERAQQNDWLKKNPGKGPSDFLAWKAKQAPLAQIAVANAAGGGMSQEAIDQAAEYYHNTGKLPPGGRGVAGLAQGRTIMNRSAELYPGSISEGTAEYAANKKSLESLQKNFDAVTAFENTAGKNLDTFLTQAKKVVDFGSPLINMPLRKAASMAGSSDQAAFSAARTTALTEIAKVLNSSNASGVLSDSARHEVEGLIGPDATLAQIYKAADILKTDMANRHQAYQDQIDDIKKRTSGKKSDGNSSKTEGNSGGFDWSKFPEHK